MHKNELDTTGMLLERITFSQSGQRRKRFDRQRQIVLEFASSLGDADSRSTSRSTGSMLTSGSGHSSAW